MITLPTEATERTIPRGDTLEHAMATCPVCDSEDLEVDEFEVDEGDVVNCPDCGASLTITSLSPLEFEAADDDEDDDDDEDVEDEDEDVDDEDDEDDDDEQEDWDE